MNIFDRMKTDFDRMIQSDMPGQNWNCDLIPDIGSGFPNTGHSISTRCICFSDDGRQDEPTIRTSHTDVLQRGDVLFLPDYDGGTFFMLEAVPQKEPNCYTSRGSRCNALISICETIPAQTDAYGFTIVEAAEKEILRNIPVVVRHAQAINTGTGAAGLFVDDELTLTIQLNAHSTAVPIEAFFDLDGTRYEIIDKTTDGASHGTITYICKRQAGRRE